VLLDASLEPNERFAMRSTRHVRNESAHHEIVLHGGHLPKLVLYLLASIAFFTSASIS